jgi:hypothetical protein
MIGEKRGLLQQMFTFCNASFKITPNTTQTNLRIKNKHAINVGGGAALIRKGFHLQSI